jgi:hypothetical protein
VIQRLEVVRGPGMCDASLPRSPLIDMPQHVLLRRQHRQPVCWHQDDSRVYWPWLPPAATIFACAMRASVLMTHHVQLLLPSHRAASLANMSYIDILCDMDVYLY